MLVIRFEEVLCLFWSKYHRINFMCFISLTYQMERVGLENNFMLIPFLGNDNAVRVLSSALHCPSSALFRHEIAYVLGQVSPL